MIFEQEFSFYSSRLSEQIIRFISAPAARSEQQVLFRAAPAVRYEWQVPFWAGPTLKFEQVFDFYAPAQRLYEQMYSFVALAGIALSEQSFPFWADARAGELYEQMYRFVSGPPVVSSAVHAGLTITVDGATMRCLSFSGGRNGYYFLYEVVVPSDQLAKSLLIGGQSEITWYSAQLLGDSVVPVVNDTIELFLKARKSSAVVSDQGDNRTTTLQLVSDTAILDALPAPIYGAAPVKTVWPAGTLATSVLADLCGSLPYSFQATDFPLAQALDGDGRYPIEIINELFPLLWIGPADDGSLLVRRKLLISPQELINEDFSNYTGAIHDLQPSEYAIEISEDYAEVPLYNSVTVTTVAESAEVIFPAPEIIENENDSSKATVLGYRYPWVPFDLITCHTGCGDLVITAGTVEIVEVSEQITFEDGEGTFPLPIYEFVSADWGCEQSLGTVTASGDGSLSAAVKAWSWATVTCKVKRMRFGLTAYNRDNDLQFRLRDE